MIDDQSQKLPENVKIQPTVSGITLTDLIRDAEPLLKQWTDSEKEKHRMELEFEYKIQQLFAKQNSIMTVGLITFLSIVLIIAGVLVYLGKDSSAMDLVKRCDGTPNRSRAAGHDVPSLNNSVFIRNLKVSPIA